MADDPTEWPIEILSPEEWRGWRDGVRGLPAQLAKMRDRGRVPMMFGQYQPSGRRYFQWICPGCGCGHMGDIGETPVSGWDSPQWTVSGLPDAVTLSPSLGCGNWRRGECIGHWWARDGKLVLA